MSITTYTQAAGDAFRSIGDFATGLVTPAVKLGVTGLARSGKTVFITALVHNLIAGARLPFFDAAAQGRVVRAYLEPQPDEIVPRFEYEKHL
ncbi:MAG: YcjX family protein, partial [Methyloceanibacter sp.]|nr:YcjX family protein [Methyloceanibacter sp.]